jgi:neurofibromin 1
MYQIEHVKEIQLSSARIPAFALAEVAFLVSLTSADSGVSQSAAKGLRLLAQMERQPGAPVNPSGNEEDRSKRYPIYEQLGDPKVMIVGECCRAVGLARFVLIVIQGVLVTRSESGS